ncbi:hypothetical protein Tco_1084228 [Tanacetum coccineum]
MAIDESWVGQQQVHGETLIMVQEYHEMTIRVSTQQARTHRPPPIPQNTKMVKRNGKSGAGRKESSVGSESEEMKEYFH